MDNTRWSNHLEALLTRRTVLQSVGALGVVGALTPRGLSAAAQSDSYPDVTIVARDFSFDMPSSIEGGHVQLTLDNQGMHDHHAIFLRVNDDATVDDVEAALQLPEFGPVFAVATSVGGPNAGPGQRSAVIVNLPPGHYVVICAIPNEEGVPHYALGMMASVEVTEPAAATTDPAADTTVTLVDMMFSGLPTEVAAGTHIWEVPNQGPSVHEIVILRLQDGVTFEMIQQMLSGPPAATPVDAAQATPVATPAASGPPPFAAIAGCAPMNPGQTNWVVLDLEAGEHVAICFVPDPATGAPHFALGMLASVSVT